MSKAKEAAAPAKILQYMLDQNRPYSAGDVFNNLHKEFGKTCVQRCLDQLVTEGKLVEKTYGKQKTYVINQSQFPDVDGSELNALDKEIAEVQKQLQESQSHCQRLNSELSALNSSLTAEQASNQLRELEKEVELPHTHRHTHKHTHDKPHKNRELEKKVHRTPTHT
ncbi:Homologous-pairing protein 2 homolog, partial [Geodia barretti]